VLECGRFTLGRVEFRAAQKSLNTAIFSPFERAIRTHVDHSGSDWPWTWLASPPDDPKTAVSGVLARASGALIGSNCLTQSLDYLSDAVGKAVQMLNHCVLNVSNP
jgi:hypothetical protein